jgi:serine/threonine protein kinase/tetratricopeptide (TPR) repeat protein
MSDKPLPVPGPDTTPPPPDEQAPSSADARPSTILPTIGQSQVPPIAKTSSQSSSSATKGPPPDWPAIPGYELLEKLGQGGMGLVFKARQRHLDRVVALKLIRDDRLTDSQALRRFNREARAVARLAHPNIVALYHADQVAGTHFLAMEYVDGTNLAKLVRQQGPLHVAQACEYAHQVCLGLQHAHQRGLVHRDIKPANLLLAADGRTVKILDMGLARLEQVHDSEFASSELTHEGVVMGTPDYLAPEQASDPRKADIRADLYSLGCTLYFLLTGRPPFPECSFTDKLVKHRVEEPEPLGKLRPDTPAGVEAVVGKLMAKRLEDRYQTPDEAAAALEPLMRAEAAAVGIASQATTVEREPSRGEIVPVRPVADSPDQAGPLGTRQETLNYHVVDAEPEAHDSRGRKRSRLHAFDLRLRLPGCALSMTVLGIAVAVGAYWAGWSRRATHDIAGTGNGALKTLKGKPKPTDGPVPTELVPGKTKVAEAEGLLNDKPWEAFQQLTKLLPEAEGKPWFSRVVLGQARAFARLDQDQMDLAQVQFDVTWAKIQDRLDQLPKQDPAENRAYRLALLLLAEDKFPSKQGKPAALLDRLVTLRQPKDLTGSLDEWERGKVEKIRRRVVAQLQPLVEQVVAHSAKRPAELEGALATAAKLRVLSSNSPLQAPYWGADAGRAFDLLHRASGLLEQAKLSVPQELHTELALAGWHKANREPRERITAWLAGFKPASPPTVVDGQVLLVKGQVQPETPAGWQAAFACYQGLLELVSDNRRVPAKDLLDQVLQPGIDKGKQALQAGATDLKKPLAHFYAVEGGLLKRYPDGPLNAKQALAAYDEAIRLDGGQVAYYVGRAYVRGQMTPPDLPKIKADATEAIRLAPDSPGGYDWTGFTLLYESRQDRKAKAAKLAEARQNYDRAITLYRASGDPERDLPTVLLYRSQVYIEWTQCEPDGSKWKGYLSQALDDAKESEALHHPHPDYPLLTQGIVLEDMGWWLGESGRYAEAVDAFTRAIEKGGRQPKYLLDRGRCSYKRVTWGKEGGHLGEARQDLQDALDGGLPPEQKVEALYWLGHVFWEQPKPDYALAEKAFTDAADTAEQIGWAGYGVPALADLANLAWHQFKLYPNADDAKDHLEAATARAARLVGVALGIQDAADARAGCDLQTTIGLRLETEKKPVKALAVYAKGLAGGPQNAEAAQLRLLNARNYLLVNEDFAEALKKHKPGVAELLAAADHGVMLAEKAEAFPPDRLSDRAEAYAVAGFCYRDAARRQEDPKEKRASRRRCIELLDGALKLMPQHPGRWLWHATIGQVCLTLAKDGDAGQWKEKGKSHLKQALKAAPVKYLDSIQGLLDEFDKVQ